MIVKLWQLFVCVCVCLCVDTEESVKQYYHGPSQPPVHRVTNFLPGLKQQRRGVTTNSYPAPRLKEEYIPVLAL